MFSVPAYSQFLDVKDKRWQKRACGMVSLKMIIDYWRAPRSNPSCDQLIKLGLKQKAFLTNVGWKHKELSQLVSKFGLRGRNFDWVKIKPETAFKKLRSYLKKYPVLASIHKNLDPAKGGHLIVVTGFRNGLVSYNDPDSKARKTVKQTAGLKKFLEGWKRRIIVIQPKSR